MDVKLCFVVSAENVATAMNLMQPFCRTATIESVETLPFEKQILDSLRPEIKPRRKAAAAPVDAIREERARVGRPRNVPGSAGTRHETALQILRRHGEPMEPKAFHNEVMRVARCDRRATYNTLAYLKLNDLVRMVRGKIAPK